MYKEEKTNGMFVSIAICLCYILSLTTNVISEKHFEVVLSLLHMSVYGITNALIMIGMWSPLINHYWSVECTSRERTFTHHTHLLTRTPGNDKTSLKDMRST